MARKALAKAKRMCNFDKAAEFSIRRARKAQNELAKKVVAEDLLPKEIKFVAGVDAAYLGNWALGATVVLDYQSLRVLETQTAKRKVIFPYVPTLLSFRELPAVFVAIKKLKLQPDVLLVDAHGRAHPYGLGFASHLGVVLDKPTVGVAKSMLIGEELQVGQDTFLFDKGKIVGVVVATLQGAKPVYVSVGHMVSLKTAVQIVRNCSRGSRIPDPIRAAHALATLERKALIEAAATV